MEKKNTKNEKPEKARIVVNQHEEFDNTYDTKIITFEKLTKQINGLFGACFADFCGANICIAGTTPPVNNQIKLPIGSLYVDLYFRDMGEAPKDLYKNIIPATQSKKTAKDDESNDNRLAHRIIDLSNRNIKSSKAYNVTRETYECLEEFLFGDPRRAPKWSELTREIQQNVGGLYGRDGICVVITGLSLEKIITALYGAKTEEGRYSYSVHLNRFDSVGYTTVANPSKSILTICRLDDNEVRKLITETDTTLPGNINFAR